MAADSAPRHAHGPFAKGFFRNEDFDFDVRGILGQAVSGGSDVGEVLAALESVGDKDHDAWYQAWFDLGSRLAKSADASAAAGHDRTAASEYLRAANYFGIAVNAVASLKDTDRLVPTFRAHRDAWDRYVDTTDEPIERVAIPYESTTLPGYLFTAGGEGPHPTLIMVNGSDGSISSLRGSGAAAAVARGYNVLLFDGPGQQSMLFEQNTSFRPDWEAVITPVIDFLVARSEVDSTRLAIYGISQAGYWVPRALAFEHRIAAAIADPGVVDVSTSWTSHLPSSLTKLLEDNETEKFDRELGFGLKLSPETERTWNFRARPYREDGFAATIDAVKKYALGAEAAKISTPLFITAPDDEQFWPGQSQKLAELTSAVSTLVPFTAAEGANYHCQPLARTLTHNRMLDWLDERLNPEK
jgi:hypothetical protein